jgi:hypothetical protein
MLLDERCEEFDRSVAAGGALVARPAGLPNARVHDFRDEIAITTDLDLFKDLVHFSGRVSSHIIETVGSDGRRSAVEEYERTTARVVATAMAQPAPDVH